MPTLTDAGIQIDDTGTLAVFIRDELDGALVEAGLPVGDYTGTLEGAYTFAAAALAYRIEQGVQIVGDMLDPDTATGNVLAGFASQLGLVRRPATASAYILRATVASGSYVLPAGTVLQGGGDDGRATWTTDAATTITTSPTALDVTCQQTGPVVFSGVTALRVVTPQPVTVTVGYDVGDGDLFTIGRVRETDAALRVRRRRSLVAVPAPSLDGIRAGMLSLLWATHATVQRQAAGLIKTTVLPAPATAAQQQELVDAIGFRLAGGSISYTTGAAGTGTYTLSDGGTSTIGWFVGGSQSVAVVAALSREPGVALADVIGAVEESIEAAFAGLDVGETILYAAVFCAIFDVEGVRGLALTLNGGTADVTPAASTSFLIPSITIT